MNTTTVKKRTNEYVHGWTKRVTTPSQTKLVAIQYMNVQMHGAGTAIIQLRQTRQAANLWRDSTGEVW